MKRSISLILVLTILLSAFSTMVVSANDDWFEPTIDSDYVISGPDETDPSKINGKVYGVMGDADYDSEISVMDATEIQLQIAQLIIMNEVCELLSDADGDGVVSVMDATEIQIYVAKYPVSGVVGRILYSPYIEPTEPPTEPTEPPTEPTEPPTEPPTEVPIVPTEPAKTTFDEIAEYVQENGTRVRTNYVVETYEELGEDWKKYRLCYNPYNEKIIISYSDYDTFWGVKQYDVEIEENNPFFYFSIMSYFAASADVSYNTASVDYYTDGYGYYDNISYDEKNLELEYYYCYYAWTDTAVELEASAQYNLKALFEQTEELLSDKVSGSIYDLIYTKQSDLSIAPPSKFKDYSFSKMAMDIICNGRYDHEELCYYFYREYNNYTMWIIYYPERDCIIIDISRLDRWSPEAQDTAVYLFRDTEGFIVRSELKYYGETDYQIYETTAYGRMTSELPDEFIYSVMKFESDTYESFSEVEYSVTSGVGNILSLMDSFYPKYAVRDFLK